MICGRCGGTGADPEFDGKCEECLEARLQAAKEGENVVAVLRALADFYEGRPCAPSLDEYSEVDGLRRAAEIVEGPIRHLEEEINKWFVKARVYGAIAAEYTKALKAILNTSDDSANTSRGIARASLEWRHSDVESNGVPMSAIEVMDELLESALELERLRGKSCSS